MGELVQFNKMLNKLRKYIIHRLGGICWTDLSEELKLKFLDELVSKKRDKNITKRLMHGYITEYAGNLNKMTKK